MGFLDTLKRLLAGDSLAIEQSSQSSSSRHTSTFTETINGEEHTTTIEVQRLNDEWTYSIDGTVYTSLADIPEPLRTRVSEIVAQL